MPHRIGEIVKKLFIPFSFIFPIIFLYFLYPDSFEQVWKGRAPLLLFTWLTILEAMLNWEKLPRIKLSKLKVIMATVPAAYVIAVFLFGLNNAILKIGELLGVPYGANRQILEYFWLLSVEYILFTACLITLLLILYGLSGLKLFSVSMIFLLAISFFYTIDTLYPYVEGVGWARGMGPVTIFQSLVPPIAGMSTSIFKWMGYSAIYAPPDVVIVWSKSYGFIPYQINWPCAGVYSIFIYTFVTLLFLKGASFYVSPRNAQTTIRKQLKFVKESKIISRLLKLAIIKTFAKNLEATALFIFSVALYLLIFLIGTIGTFFVNVIRIVTIFKLSVDVGGQAAEMFHSYYGELYFVAWIFLYLLIMFCVQRIWTKMQD